MNAARSAEDTSPVTCNPVRTEAAQRIEPGTRRRALDEQSPARRDLQRREQAARDRAEIEHVAARLLQRQIGRDRVHLRRLHRQELRVAAGLGLVPLDREARVHRVVADLRAEQVVGPRIDRHQIADLDAPLAARLAAERRHQRDAARAGDLDVFFMRVERRHGDAGQRPDVVEVDLAGQHVEQGFVGRWFGNLDDQLALVRRGRAEAGRAGLGIAGDAERVLPFGDRVTPG